MSTQSSMYIPISDPPIQVPAYVCMNRSSQWHTAGLLSVALESITLQSRVRATSKRRWMLTDFEAAINVNGKQRIAKLECSVMDPQVLQGQKRERGIKEASAADQRMPGTVTSSFSLLDGLQAAKDASLRRLDMDFFAGYSSQTEATTSIPSGRRTKVAKGSHTFAYLDCFRGDFERPCEEDGGDAAYTRKRRRIAGKPLVEKLVSICFFPIFLFFLFSLHFCLFVSFTSPSLLALFVTSRLQLFSAIQVDPLFLIPWPRSGKLACLFLTVATNQFLLYPSVSATGQLSKNILRMVRPHKLGSGT